MSKYLHPAQAEVRVGAPLKASEGEWEMPEDGKAPPDLTGCSQTAECHARSRPGGGWTCTRRAGHTGRHAAGTSLEIVAVWR